MHLHDRQLELLDIIRQKIENTDHAFLSACQTSAGDEKLSEEVVHLAAGMLAAGYQDVVATMWSIKDQYAPDIAMEFYTHLLEGTPATKEGRLDSTGAAGALDHAVGKIRQKLGDTEEALLIWVPYVHFGI
jgi:CHAT domain-containing protein